MIERPDFRESMRALPATLFVGVGAVVTLALSVVTLKVFAQLLGPAGGGTLALLQSVLNITAIVFAFGLNVTVIGEITRSERQQDSGSEPLGRSAVSLAILGGISGAALVSLGSAAIVATILRKQFGELDVLFVALAAGLTVPAWILIAIQSARHRIRSVTGANIATAVAAAVFGIGLVILFGRSALAAVLLVTAGAQLLIAVAVSVSGRIPRSRPADASSPSARLLLRRGIPVVMSQLAGLGTAFLIPLLVLSFAGTAAVGLYRAAAAVSVGYLTFFLASLTQDYLPRIASARDDAQLRDLLDGRMRIVFAIGAPLIVALLAGGPWLLNALYSPEFEPAIAILQWTLIGDLFRLPASVLTLVLLAQGTTIRYLAFELVGGALVFVSALLGLAVGGLAGLGIGYAVAQAANYAVVWTVVRRYAPATPGRLQLVVIGVAVVCAAVVLIGASYPARLALFGAIAIGLATAAWPRLARMHAAGEL